jgi:hypothetical protein
MEAARVGNASIVELLLAVCADVNAAANNGFPALVVASRRAHAAAVEVLLAHPRIHPSVAAAEAAIGEQAHDEGPDAELRAASVREAFARWHRAQAVCAAARAPVLPGAATAGQAPPALVAALAAAREAGVSAAALSAARDADGFTALGGAAAAGASEWAVRALVRAGCSALVAGDREGASPGALAARAGHAKLSAQLYQAAARAAARAQPAFLRVRSELVLFNRVPGGLPQEYLPRDVVDHMLEWCATADCWFAMTPPAEAPPAVAVAPGGAPAAAAGSAAAVAVAEADDGGGAAEGSASGMREPPPAKRARTE